MTARSTEAAVELKPRSVMLSGGVAANSRLKEFLAEKCAAANLKFYVPKLILTTDNAAMIAAAAFPRFHAGILADTSLNATASLPLA